MSIYGSAVKRPITTILVFVAMMVIGVYSLTQLPIDLYPEIELPFLSVYTTYPGASASDIETNVTRPVENALSSVSKLKEITSRSSDNISVVFLEFEYETNLDEASNDVRSNLSFVQNSLPEDAEDPVILKFNSSMMPIIFYAITARESYAGLEKILDQKVVNPLNRIDGVGSVGLSGVPGRSIYVDVDPQKMEAYNLTVEQIGNVLGAENLNMPAGYIEMGKTDYPIRIQGEFEESDQIKNIVVGNAGGKNIYLRDIATVRDTIRDSRFVEKINGDRGMSLFVQKMSGANTVKVCREVDNELKKLQKDLPSDVRIEKIFDSSDFIKGSISNLTETLMYAAIFVVLVVLFFLGRWRATFIIILTIPISLIAAFIYLFVTGNSINIISLSSLSIAIGMVVDDAIVVLENITKHIERGSTPREAAIYATNEVWLAVIVTTLTVVAVFFPLTFVKGLTGVMFRQLGMIVSITIIVSVFAAITLTPTLSALMLKLRPVRKDAPKLSWDGSIRKLLDGLDNIYVETIHWALHHKKVVVALAVVIFVGSMGLFAFIGAEFIPSHDESTASATVELQTGTKYEQSLMVADRIDSLIHARIPEVTLISTSTGSDDAGGFASIFSAGGTHKISYTFKLLPVNERKRSVEEVAESIREIMAPMPEIINYSVSTSSNDMSMGSNTVNVEIYGYDFTVTNKLAEELAARVKNIAGAKDVTISRSKSKPELQIKFDNEKLLRYGLSTAQAATMVKNRIDGLTATQLRQFGDEYDVIVRYKKDARNTLTEVENIGITTPAGKVIRLNEIADVKESWSPPNIERKRKERVVTVAFTPYKRALSDIVADVQQVIGSTKVPSGVMLQVSGSYEDMADSFKDLALLMVVSLILVYLIMASQFESLKMPVIIMFSIPFAFSGVAIALFLTHTKLSVIAAIGAVMLIGIVVKNAIVLVDFINLVRDRGVELYEAVVVSGRSRLRPVLMTSATTILGMLPLAMSSGEGAEIWSPMGIAVIGGLVFSTFVTLIIVPVGYVLMARHGERDRKHKVAYRDMKFLNGIESKTEN
ncbi:MAG TPA: efflux RND transporter permease subunit [Bacteroidales bacterium]|nr:efflux RND transporter permease subunit [Bacteroidales bacterium]HPT11968.1 efflux RND transporter permease subunit [Bacteroidales bacterium]